VKEYFDSPEVLEENARRCAQLIKESKHFVVYTGAGISTAAKIPDYRGPQGVWTLQAKGLMPTMEISLEQALPTYSHIALYELMKRDMLKFIVSTNVDGLHRRSGIPEEQLSELHGNIYREVCPLCEAEYLRPFDVRPDPEHRRARFTGRLCERPKRKEFWSEEERAAVDAGGGPPLCDGKLVDSIINFGEKLPKHALDLASQHSQMADLTLVIGSSMRVSPACELPSKSYIKGGKFCICNLQKTPFEKYVGSSHGLRIHARCDDFMRLVMAELGIEVTPFILNEEKVVHDLQNMRLDPSSTSTSLSESEISSNLKESDVTRRRGNNVGSMADDGPPRSILEKIRAGVSLRSPAPVSSAEQTSSTTRDS